MLANEEKMLMSYPWAMVRRQSSNKKGIVSDINYSTTKTVHV
jgi:hypothetical protein